MDDIETYFTCQDCQEIDDVAHWLADFIGTAKHTLEIAIYSFSLCPDTKDIIASALRERQNAGVKVRICYDGRTAQPGSGDMGDECNLDTPTFVQSLGFPCRSVTGYQALMHHKYVLVDAETPDARIWTGSLNWTEDAWHLQDNNIIILRSPELARFYLHDFNELWVDGNLAPSGTMDSGEDTIQYKGHPAHVLVNFSPGEGEWIDQAICNQIDRTNHHATLAFAVLTSGNILRSLQDLMKRGVPLNGVYDETQMEGVKYQWNLVQENHWKIPAFEELVKYGQLVGKRSTPYSDKSQHDFMHNKIMVLDDVVITGSYNFSRHAQKNAENMLLIASDPLVETYSDYLTRLMDKYRQQGSQPEQPADGKQEAKDPELAAQ